MLGNDERNLENMLILSAGKFFGFCLAFMIPFFLSRWLTIEGYGTYKQLILLWMIFAQIQNLGMDLGLFYFVKTEPVNAPIFSLNVILVNTVTTLVNITFLNYFASDIGNLLNNPELGIYLPYFSLLLFFSIITQHFEHYLINLNKIKLSLLVEGIIEVIKSCIIIFGFLLLNSLKSVLLLLAALYLLKLVALLSFNLKLIKKTMLQRSVVLPLLWRQVSYGFPLGVARIISAVIYFDKLIVSFMFSVTRFTVYSVGCFELPFVHTVLNTIWELASLEMVDARKQNNRSRLIELMRDTIRKIAVLTTPIALFSVVFGYEIIVFIFSHTYESSVPYFRIFMLIFITSSFDCELLFRVFRANSIFLKIQIFNLFITLLLMILLGLNYGPLGALIGKVSASIINSFVMFKNVRTLLAVPLSRFIPWSNIAFATAISTFLSLFVYLISNLINLKGFLQLAFSAIIYFALVFLIFAMTGIISKMEKEYIKRKVVLFNVFVKSKIL